MELVGSSLDKHNQKHLKEVDDYISKSPQDIQSILNKIRSMILETHPKIQEAFKYQMPTYVLKKNIFHFAANKNHLGIYPTPHPIEHFKDELFGYKTSKGAIQFPYHKEIPYELIQKIISFQVNKMIEEENSN